MITELKYLETNRFELANVRWKRLICITDAERYGGPISNLKALTGGNVLRMEEKYVQGRQDRTADGLVLIAANEEVQSSDYTSGLGRRRLTIYFTHVPSTPLDLLSVHGRTFQGAFVADLPGLLNWVLALPDATMHEVLSLHYQQSAPSLRAHWRHTLLATNPLAGWAHRHLVFDDAATNVGTARKVGHATNEYDPSTARTVTVHTTHYTREDVWIYKNYIAYTELAGGKAMALQRFAQTLEDLLLHHLKASDVHHTDDMYGSRFHGVRLRTKQDDANGLPLLLDHGPEVPF
jgi:putative DNA primase/helicase